MSIDDIKHRITRMIDEGQSDPKEILRQLIQEGEAEKDVRAAISDLIGRNDVIFTKDLHLSVNPLIRACA
jgi:hypothetical protein